MPQWTLTLERSKRVQRTLWLTTQVSQDMVVDQDVVEADHQKADDAAVLVEFYVHKGVGSQS